MSVLINLSALLGDAKYFELVRQPCWPQGVCCPKCGSEHVLRNGHNDTQPHCQRYLCNNCQFRFDDLWTRRSPAIIKSYAFGYSIPGSRENPKILGIDDAEVV